MRLPAALNVTGSALFEIARLGTAVNLWVSSSVSVTVAPAGVFALTVATLVNIPVFISSCVIV